MEQSEHPTTASSEAPDDRSKRKTLLVLVIALGMVGLSLAAWWFGYEAPRRRAAETAAAAYLKQAGALVITDPQSGTVQGIDLAGQQVNLQVIAHISQLPKLRQLNLSDADLSNEELKGLRANSVVSLVLNDNPINSEALQSLQGMSGLSALYLINTSVDDRGLTIIGKLEELTNLGLSGTRIRGEGLIHLQKLEHLAHLTLDDTQVSSKHLRHLEAMPRLSRLGLKNCPVTDEAVQSLQKAIPGLRVER